MATQPPPGFKRLAGSERKLPAQARLIGPVDPNERIEVSVYLRDPAASSPAGDINAYAQQPGPRMTREEYIASHSASPDDLAKVEAFAREHNLTVVETDPAARKIVLAGTAAQMMEAFGTQLQHYDYQGSTFRGRTSYLHIPSELDKVIVGVFGLDDRPQAQPHLRYPVPSSVVPQASAAISYTRHKLPSSTTFQPALMGAASV